MGGCNRLEDLMTEQRRKITRHIDRHSYFNHIEDKQKAIEDFLGKYAFVMREAFCDLCSESAYCEAYQTYLIKNGIVSFD